MNSNSTDHVKQLIEQDGTDPDAYCDDSETGVIHPVTLTTPQCGLRPL